jgi:hypothetical protein
MPYSLIARLKASRRDFSNFGCTTAPFFLSLKGFNNSGRREFGGTWYSFNNFFKISEPF